MVSSEPSPLCCCEYTNLQGQRSHILAVCCDCVDLDNSVDQCLKGNSISGEKCDIICRVVEDRIRIPWPHGARQLDFGVVIPPVVLLFSLHLAAYQLVFTILVLVYLPLFVVFYYIYALKNRKTTWFFVSWGLSSVWNLRDVHGVCVAPLRRMAHRWNLRRVCNYAGLLCVCSDFRKALEADVREWLLYRTQGRFKLLFLYPRTLSKI